ncbi:Beta-galactosidase [Vibrio rotiferianus]|nr:Beta-galactosidase [Vibrio rotiferianus]
MANKRHKKGWLIQPFLLYRENPQLGWGFRRAYSYKSVI